MQFWSSNYFSCCFKSFKTEWGAAAIRNFVITNFPSFTLRICLAEVLFPRLPLLFCHLDNFWRKITPLTFLSIGVTERLVSHKRSVCLLRIYASCCEYYQGLSLNQSSSTNVHDVFIYALYCNRFRPVWWPSSGESYKLFKEVTFPTTDPLCLVQLCV
jgi:hypothetical protein